jgi:hypothetical protein
MTGSFYGLDGHTFLELQFCSKLDFSERFFCNSIIVDRLHGSGRGLDSERLCSNLPLDVYQAGRRLQVFRVFEESKSGGSRGNAYLELFAVFIQNHFQVQPTHPRQSMDSTSPEMVDCDLLEAAKENVQPLASGRRVTALSTILSTPHALRDPKLVQERTKLRATVTSALQTDSSTAGEDEEVVEDPSPLVAYSTFVTWTLEHYPQGHSAESGLLELLEEATRVLKDHDDGRYRDELKYLKLWILYASFVEKPVIVYKFLLANDIGVSWGALYEEFALVLEREGR